MTRLLIFTLLVFAVDLDAQGRRLRDRTGGGSGAAPEVVAYWVSPTGAATWANCDSVTPLSSTAACPITTANTNAAAGDVIYLRAGTYTGNVFIDPTNDGTSSEPITWSAYNNESVIVNTDRVINGTHESGAWTDENGATVTHDATEAWDGSNSTKFTVTAEDSGIHSDAMTLTRDITGLQMWYTVRVKSTTTSVNIQVKKTDGSATAYDQDRTIVANQWNTLQAGISLPSTGSYYIYFRSPTGVTSGTWYVDGVTIHPFQGAILLNGDNYHRILGISVTSAYQGFSIQSGSSHNEIGYSTFSNMHVFAASRIVDNSVAASAYNWLHHNTFHDTGYVARIAAGDDCDDIQAFIKIGGDIGTDESRYNLLENNAFYHAGHDLLIVGTKYNTVRNNFFHNEGWIENIEGPCQDADGDAKTFNDPASFGNRNLIFETTNNQGGYNLIEGNRIGHAGTPPDDDGANCIENPSDGNLVRYNLLFKCGAAGFFFKGQPGINDVDELPDHNIVVHNTIYSNGGGEDISAGFQAGVFLVCGVTYVPDYPTGNVIKHNIVYDNTVTYSDPSSCLNNGYTYTSNFETNPLFVNTDVSDPSSSTLPDLSLQASSTAIDAAGALTTVHADDTGSGTTLKVTDARYFQDGTWAPSGRIQADTIAIGTVSNTVLISSIDYTTNTITLASSVSRTDGQNIWLYKKSDGVRVLYGSAPDYGASERAQ